MTGGAIPAIFPGPLLANLRGRSLTEAGYERIVAEAQATGLLDGGDDRAAPAPGGQTAIVDLWVDGAMHTIQGDPNRVMQCVRAPCAAPPGTPEAFGAFWSGIHDLAAVMPWGDVLLIVSRGADLLETDELVAVAESVMPA